MTRRALLAGAAAAFAAMSLASAQQPQQQDPQSFRFRTGVELINVTATVSDSSGRFVSGLRKEDFRLFEDGVEQQITHFNSERVPVSLGIVVDTSGSMEGEKWLNAKQALNRFLYELLDERDEIFLYRFDNVPELVEDWTSDRSRIAAGLARIRPRGATSLYDAVIEALPLAQTGRHRKKALVVISDGNDTNSRATIRELKTLVRESEVLIYAVGIDSQAVSTIGSGRQLPPRGMPPPYDPPPYEPPVGASPPPQGPRLPIPLPFPTPGRPKPVPQPPPQYPPHTPPTNPVPPVGGTYGSSRMDDRVNVAALRDITDDSGGRTEIVRSGRDLEPATASIADELSKQYYLGYTSQTKRDAQWHAIRVDVRDGRYLVRARRGYIATP